MKSFFQILCLLLMTCEISAMDSNIRFVNVSNKNGLPNNTINAICQDNRGFIWIGTDNGLCKYDGHLFQMMDLRNLSGESYDSKNILNVFQDSFGFLWIVTSHSILKYDLDQEKIETVVHTSAIHSPFIFQCADGKLLMTSNDKLSYYNWNSGKLEPLSFENMDVRGRFTTMLEDPFGNLWMGTQTDGLLWINANHDSLRRYKKEDTKSTGLGSNRITVLHQDAHSRIWVGTQDNGLYIYSPETETFTFQSNIGICSVSTLCEDQEGNLWIGTDKGIYIYNFGQSSIVSHIEKDYYDSNGLSDNFISVLCRDSEGNMLVGTTYGGLDICLRAFRKFHLVNWGQGKDELSGRTVRAMVADSKDNLWIATEDGNLNYWDRQTGEIHVVVPEGCTTLNPYSLLMDSEDRLWIGTKFNGLYRYDTVRKKFRHFPLEQYPGLSVNNILSLLEDSHGVIWIGTSSGIAIYDEEKDYFMPFNPRTFRKQSIDCLYMDKFNNVWITTRNIGLFCYVDSNQALRSFKKYISVEGICPDNRVNSVFQDRQGRMWISTNEGGVNCFEPEKNLFKNYTTEDFLPSNTIYSIIEDLSGHIWMSSDNGLSRFHTGLETFTNFSVSEGLPNRQFNNNSSYRDAEGRLYFGSIDGLLYFHPDSLEIAHSRPVVQFTDLQVLGKHVRPGKDAPVLHALTDRSEVRLSYSQAESFTLKYTVPTISHASSVIYSTKLDPSGEWTSQEASGQINFVKLTPGEYVFQVKASFNNHWDGSEPVSSVKIIVEAPFWRSNVAYVCYMLLSLLALFAIFGAIRQQQKKKSQKIMEEMEKERSEELNKMRMNFFTNISHQIRIPLSLILAPLETMMGKDTFTGETRHKMELMQHNAIKMKMLVDELLQFNKLKNSSGKICLQQGNIQKFIYDVAVGFQLLADEKQLEFIIDVPQDNLLGWFSPKNVEKIVFNLLSNAFKYTSEGRVVLHSSHEVKNGVQMLALSVEDTGIGIPDEELSHIFDGYYQVRDTSHKSQQGFGIGLALTKELVIKHQGCIRVESHLGQGTVFHVELTIDRAAFTSYELEDSTDREIRDCSFMLQEKSCTPQPVPDLQNGTERKHRLLLVEDETDLLNFYNELFSGQYQVSLAKDGSQGLEMAVANMPDLIISDVMMPVMDGVTMCRKLKENIRTCHIPVILLTAKTDLSSKMDGLDVGANLYLEKPFHPSVLVKYVTNILSSRDYFVERYNSGFGQIDDMEISEMDKKFLLDIEKSVKDNLSNDHYSIHDLTEGLGISRTLLHVKLKALVGMSTTEYINFIRMEESKNLLLKGYRVSEAAYATGFSSPSYYTRCFTKRYGMSPVEFVNSSKNN